MNLWRRHPVCGLAGLPVLATGRLEVAQTSGLKASSTTQFLARTLIALTILGATVAAFGADARLKLPLTRRSQQFVVHDARTPAQNRLTATSTNSTRLLIELNPDVLLISAERTREELYGQLGIPSDGAGKIHLTLRSAADEDRTITIVSGRFADGWQYRVDIPDRIEELDLTRGLVEALLREYANRMSGSKPAELPAWLIEGLTCHLLVSAGPRLIVGATPVGSLRRLVHELQGADPLREAREFFAANQALSFSELSRPDVAQLSGERLRAYQHSAHILVCELVRLPNGRAALLAMLRDLPFCWNWETAFLRAYQPAFQRLLDVEKWWSVTIAGFVGRDQRLAWSREICLQKIEDALSVRAQVRLTTNTIPVHVQATLQQVIAEWDYDSQKVVLPHVIQQLTMLRYSAPTNVIPLIDSYRLCLHNYLQKRAQAGASPATRRQFAVRAGQLVEETVRQLDALLLQREVLRRSGSEPAPQSEPPAQSTAQSIRS